MPEKCEEVAYVASKKVGNAVARNRAKRRLRALFSQVQNDLQDGSYIFVAKKAVVDAEFSTIESAFYTSLKRLKTYKR